MITVAQFKTRITPKLHGTSLAKISAIYEKMQEASGVFQSMVRPHSLIRRARIENAIYDKVYNYAVQDDMEVDGVVDIRPIGPRNSTDSLQGSFSQQFDIKKKADTFAIEYINGVKTLRLSKNLTPRTLLADLNSLTIGATITGAGDVQNLDLDYLDYLSGNASVVFGLSGATGSADIEIALANTIDISTLEGLGALFHWLKFPDATRLNSVRIRISSTAGGASNYAQATATAAHDRSFESDAWMLIRYLLSSATSSGTPNFAAITHIQIHLDYDTGVALTNCKLDNVTASLGEAWEVVYYSNRLFTDTTGVTWKEIPTAETDILRLDGSIAQTAYIYQFMLTLQQELKGKNMATDYAFFTRELGNGENDGKLYSRLKLQNPDMAVVRQVDYYEFDDIGEDLGMTDDED